ncbi:MAG: hypothetical protein IT342_21515 [Candidatus Melainabacteria bacterium]|nr:hypothetical protein [Candidatus Melainabacteria bacterium]
MNIKRPLALGAMIIGVGFFGAFAHQAQAAVPTCTDYRTINPAANKEYPNDGHYFVCFNATNQAAEQIRLPVRSLKNGSANVWNTLKNQNVQYAFFADRADAVAWMNANPAYTPMAATAGSARCGSTGFSQGGTKPILVAIYETCTFNNPRKGTPPLPTNILNPNLRNITLHETGHAFDFAIGKSQGLAFGPSSSRAFKKMVGTRPGVDQVNNGPLERSDMVKIDIGDQTHGPEDKCGLYDSVAPSQLERDLGYPTILNKTVCTGTTVNPDFVGMTPSQVAKQQSPYFVNPPNGHYQEVWAQGFAVKTGLQTSPRTTPFYDRLPGALRCSNLAMTWYYDFLLPLPAAKQQTNNCPRVTDNDFKVQ